MKGRMPLRFIATYVIGLPILLVLLPWYWTGVYSNVFSSVETAFGTMFVLSATALYGSLWLFWECRQRSERGMMWYAISASGGMAGILLMAFIVILLQ